MSATIDAMPPAGSQRPAARPPVRGRFAPSPTGRLHVGNLRTAIAAWATARQAGGGFVVRMEDLDPMTARVEHERGQLDDLTSVGIDWDGPVVRQSERAALYADAIATLGRDGLVYRCYCTRREIREAASAPHGDGLPGGAYPGTCRRLSDKQRRSREREGRPAALRLRCGGPRLRVDDLVAGSYEGLVDDVVLLRNDGVAAYNLAVVVDDAAQGITLVVRGDDLLASTPRQMALQALLGLETPQYAHVPLVVGRDGQRLSKRHGAVTLHDLAARGVTVDAVVAWITSSLCRAGPALASLDALVERFAWTAIPLEPIVFDMAPSPP